MCVESEGVGCVEGEGVGCVCVWRVRVCGE